ncbi:CBS domain-containing protein [Halorientalis halophila]|uniref:CBS domain-containing protein n=1 Tax=Halorientalis halophila TaxID=3108499 RepID=UPI00300AB9D3
MCGVFVATVDGRRAAGALTVGSLPETGIQMDGTLMSRGVEVGGVPFPIRVQDVMSSPAETAPPDLAASDGASRCYEASIGSLVVVAEGEVVGIVTSDDFVHLLGEDPDPGARPLSAFMSSDVVTVDASATVGDAVARMFDADVARLVVLEDDELVGLVSTDDVLRHVPQVLQRRAFTRAEPGGHGYRCRRETAYDHPDWTVTTESHSDRGTSVGDRVTFTKVIDEQDVRTFAAASGDTNRLHLDDAYARETRFGRRIVHGTLVSGLISAALARLPGVTIYLSQDLTFLEPAEIGERLTAVCEIVDSLGRKKYQLTTDVVDEGGERLVEGQAAVLIDETPDAGQVTFEAIAES